MSKLQAYIEVHGDGTGTVVILWDSSCGQEKKVTRLIMPSEELADQVLDALEDAYSEGKYA